MNGTTAWDMGLNPEKRVTVSCWCNKFVDEPSAAQCKREIEEERCKDIAAALAIALSVG